MYSKHQHRAAALLLAATLVGVPALADEPAPAPTTKPSPGAAPGPRRTIRLSIEPAVEEVLKAHERPCDGSLREGVPCFPVTVETEGPRFSVAESLRRYRPLGRPAPGGPPTTDEIQGQLSGAPRSPSGGFSFDPVCTVKSLGRALRGRATTFYLYRLQDGLGTRPLLLDHKLSREALEVRPEIRELLGEYHGECEAVAAWRKELRAQLAADP